MPGDQFFKNEKNKKNLYNNPNMIIGMCEARAVHGVPGDPANSRRETLARLHSQRLFHKYVAIG